MDRKLKSLLKKYHKEEKEFVIKPFPKLREGKWQRKALKRQRKNIKISGVATMNWDKF